MTDRQNPLVSIIVPVYNVEPYLDCCLRSIRGQTYDRLEIIVVEDCSTDGSLARLAPHVTDPRLHLIRHDHNSGLAAARNTGIEAATGDYVMFVDSDDALESSAVLTCVAHLQKTSADLLIFDFAVFQDGEALPAIARVSKPDCMPAREEYFASPHFAWLKFIRTDLLRDPTLRFPVGLYYEDWPFHWKLGFAAHSIYILRGQWYFYRQRITSITASSDRKLLDQFKVEELVLKAVGERGRPPEIQALTVKILESFWAVLTRIEIHLLPEAVAAAKRLLTELRIIARIRPGNARSALITLLLSLPAPITVCTVHLIRQLKEAQGLRWVLRSTKNL